MHRCQYISLLVSQKLYRNEVKSIFFDEFLSILSLSLIYNLFVQTTVIHLDIHSRTGIRNVYVCELFLEIDSHRITIEKCICSISFFFCSSRFVELEIGNYIVIVHRVKIDANKRDSEKKKPRCIAIIYINRNIFKR